MRIESKRLYNNQVEHFVADLEKSQVKLHETY